MIKQIQILSAFLIFFFVLPIIAGILPFPNNEKIEYPKAEQQPVVYAASNETETATATDVSQPLNPF
ncbi:stage II sporulation protein P, partial [Butyricicoccus sp. 1XD8-22]